jgi:hypothetical protein
VSTSTALTMNSLMPTLLDIHDTTDAKNSKDMNNSGNANNIENQEETNVENQEETNVENQEETVITVLTAKAESDPEWSAGFKTCHSTKNKKTSDYETLENYSFVVNFNKKWFLRRVMVKVRFIFLSDIHLTIV